jgi:predicted nucleic acid-binding protein
MQVARTRMVTTEEVLLEVGNSLARLRFRPAAAQLLQSLTNDSQVEVEPINAAWFRRGLQLFEARPDKEWGLVDCVSFVVMQDRGITDALTSDEHFEQAGFIALLRQE